MEPNTKSQIYLKHSEIFFVITCLNVRVVMCGPRKLFFQCGPEMPKGWTPVADTVKVKKPFFAFILQIAFEKSHDSIFCVTFALIKSGCFGLQVAENLTLKINNLS